MKFRQYCFIAGLQFLPLCVFAHGEEVIFTFALPIIPAIIFLIALNFIHLTPSGKRLLIFIYFLALLLAFFLIKDWPYNDNAEIINVLLTLLAPAAAFFAYFILKKRDSVLRRKEFTNFLNGDDTNDVEENEKGI